MTSGLRYSWADFIHNAPKSFILKLEMTPRDMLRGHVTVKYSSDKITSAPTSQNSREKLQQPYVPSPFYCVCLFATCCNFAPSTVISLDASF